MIQSAMSCKRRRRKDETTTSSIYRSILGVGVVGTVDAPLLPLPPPSLPPFSSIYSYPSRPRLTVYIICIFNRLLLWQQLVTGISSYIEPPSFHSITLLLPLHNVYSFSLNIIQFLHSFRSIGVLLLLLLTGMFQIPSAAAAAAAARDDGRRRRKKRTNERKMPEGKILLNPALYLTIPEELCFGRAARPPARSSFPYLYMLFFFLLLLPLLYIIYLSYII